VWLHVKGSLPYQHSRRIRKSQDYLSQMKHRALAVSVAVLCVAAFFPTTTAAAAPSGTARSAAASATSPAQAAFDSMTDAERVGQLFMIGCSSTSVSSDCLTDITNEHIGSVILDGTSHLSIAQEHTVTAALQARAPAHLKLFVATDQEGGYVRRMQGPGFTDYSTALVQGTWYTADLQHWATTWGTQLKAAGINLNLAPVLDTVPPGDTNNPPIGDLDREYAHYSGDVTTQGGAVLRGLNAGGVDATVKHFPGLGQVTGNTDTTAGVTDTRTTTTSAYLKPFAAAVKWHKPFVMMSTAIYARIDGTRPAAFSPPIITGLLRGTLGFRGVVISDDLGAAKQVASFSVGSRAWRFVGAGGDIVLTVKASLAAQMIAAIRSRMCTSPTFTKQVDASVMRVLEAKQAWGLLN